MSCQVCKNKAWVVCDEKGLICLDCLNISKETCFSHDLVPRGLSKDVKVNKGNDYHHDLEEKLASALETIKQLQERENLLKHDIDVLSKLKSNSSETSERPSLAESANSVESTPSSAPVIPIVKKKGLSVKN